MFSFTIRGKEYQAATLAGISAAYCKARDESGEGASTFPFPVIDDHGYDVGRLSYNGRIWPIGCNLDSTPLYDPGADPVPALLAALKFAVERVKVANAEDDPILSAWLPDAHAAIAKAETALT